MAVPLLFAGAAATKGGLFAGAAKSGLVSGLTSGLSGLFGSGGKKDKDRYESVRVAVQNAYNSGDFARAQTLWDSIPIGSGRYPSNSLSSHIMSYGNANAKANYPVWKAQQALKTSTNTGSYPSTTSKTNPQVSGSGFLGGNNSTTIVAAIGAVLLLVFALKK